MLPIFQGVCRDTICFADWSGLKCKGEARDPSDRLEASLPEAVMAEKVSLRSLCCVLWWMVRWCRQIAGKARAERR